jgi:hypothetical protein
MVRRAYTPHLLVATVPLASNLMSYVKIGNEQRSLSDADQQWVNDQLRRRRADGTNICVQVVLKSGSIDMVLATPDCGTGGGGGRRPTSQESELFQLWAKRGLSDPNFNAGDVIAFLSQIRSL